MLFYIFLYNGGVLSHHFDPDFVILCQVVLEKRKSMAISGPKFQMVRASSMCRHNGKEFWVYIF